MATNGDDDEKHIDDLWQRQKHGLEATAEWSDVVMRIADALEHNSVSQTMMTLTAMGYKTEYKAAPKHRAECPNCMAIKYAHPVKVVVPPGAQN